MGPRSGAQKCVASSGGSGDSRAGAIRFAIRLRGQFAWARLPPFWFCRSIGAALRLGSGEWERAMHDPCTHPTSLAPSLVCAASGRNRVVSARCLTTHTLRATRIPFLLLIAPHRLLTTACRCCCCCSSLAFWFWQPFVRASGSEAGDRRLEIGDWRRTDKINSMVCDTVYERRVRRRTMALGGYAGAARREVGSWGDGGVGREWEGVQAAGDSDLRGWGEVLDIDAGTRLELESEQPCARGRVIAAASFCFCHLPFICHLGAAALATVGS
ncbi:hypothetical protein DFH09DRAFT_71074 [Mycena vulgaris]|nr:hypothetical protein DFH09DRAFT_71074 [Mycena vulgaris]